MSATRSWESYGFIVLVLILQVAVYLVVYSDVPVARMVVCFLYLMFVPGIAILKLLELKNLDTAEKVLFSTGLSIAFLMFAGLIINEIGRMAFTNPLSLNVLLISINTVVLLMSLIVTRRGGSSLPLLPQLKRSEWLFPILSSISLLVLGSYGIVMVNASGNSFLLLLLIVATSIAVASVFLSEKIFSSRSYPLILFVISICMLFFVSNGTSLITKYITGNGDQWIEFYAFRLTQTKGFWDPTLTSSSYTPTLFPTYSMLSVTVLPAVFSVITGLDGSSTFQLLYPLVVAFLALGSYKLYRTQIDSKMAFLATFFLITVSVGKGWGSDKQQIAQVFYVLLFLLLFKKDMPNSKKSILLVIFSAGLVVSHYALAYIFLLSILAAFLFFVWRDYNKSGLSRLFSDYGRKIPLIFVLIFLTIAFSWYIFVNSSATFSLLAQEVNTVASDLNQFFNPASRGTALQGLGVVQTPTILNSISTAFFLVTEFLLVVGFVILIFSRKKSLGFSLEYKVIATINMIIIAIDVLLPGIADTFLMERFYQTTLIILAPLAILGGKTIIELIPRPSFQKLYASILVFVVLIPLFLFQTGFVYEVAKVQSLDLPVSMYRWNALDLYSYTVNAQEVTGAQWLSTYTNTNSIFVYSDSVSQYQVLTAYGMMERGRVSVLSSTTIPASNDYVYLSDVDLINQGGIFNVSQISPILQDQNEIYSNGQCEIYKGYAP
jgi:uncharacterized membrane protein